MNLVFHHLWFLQNNPLVDLIIPSDDHAHFAPYVHSLRWCQRMADVSAWVLCDAPPTNSALTIEFEAVERDAKTNTPLGTRVAAPMERFELRPLILATTR